MPNTTDVRSKCLELAKQMRGQWDGETGATESDCELIYALVNPLVEALRKTANTADVDADESAWRARRALLELGIECPE